MGLNTIALQGNLTRDPVLNVTTNSRVCKFNIAVSEKKAGEQEVFYIDVTIWGAHANACAEYLKKGSGVIASGKLKQESWKDKESGEPRYKWLILANDVTFLSTPRNDSAPMPLGKDKIKTMDPNTGQGEFDFDAPPF